MLIRPKILLTYGRINRPLRVPMVDLTVNAPQTFLTTNTASGTTALSVKNVSGLSLVYPEVTTLFVIIGDPMNLGCEIIRISSFSTPGTITLSSATAFTHSNSTTVRVVPYNQVELSKASTATGAKTVISTITLTPAQENTELNDSSSSVYYFARFRNSIDSIFSDYSDAASSDGYGLLSARSVIDQALGEINKENSPTLTDEFAFQQLDAVQTEVLSELKRWSFMQKFNSIIGQVATGSWKVAMPSDLDDQNTNKSIYNLKLGANPHLTWVDKEKFDQLLSDMAFTTLASTLSVSDATVTLTDSSDFTATGTITIGAYTYGYTANNTTTGVLTLTVVVPSGEAQVTGADIFQNPQSGMPMYWTTFGGYIYYLPITSSTYNGKNLYLDYYIKQTRIQRDSDSIVFPDATLAIYYLCSKFLVKLANGAVSDSSEAYWTKYQNALKKLKQKEVMNRTFIFKPRYQNWGAQSQWDDGDPRWIRDGNFPNTGF